MVYVLNKNYTLLSSDKKVLALFFLVLAYFSCFFKVVLIHFIKLLAHVMFKFMLVNTFESKFILKPSFLQNFY